MTLRYDILFHFKRRLKVYLFCLEGGDKVMDDRFQELKDELKMHTDIKILELQNEVNALKNQISNLESELTRK
jgi:polyhydroxyalkanoate synthesis regulator phasin